MKSFIICLSKISESLKTATDLKTQLESFGQETELFEGTYGNDAVTMMEEEGRSLHPHGIKGPLEPASSNLEKLLAPGVKGCFYSHYRLWQKCVELNEPILIFEDDIVLKRPFTDVVWRDVLVVAIGHPTKSVRFMDNLENPVGNPGAKEYKLSSMPGCCGYAIKPHAAKILLHTYHKTYLPADNAINRNVLLIQIHSHLMGIALTKKDGKKSLTRLGSWGEPNDKDDED
jgi:GR25 family glycosyltransferase involved in LPS biosynthesis